MLGFMNEEAYRKTVETGKVTFFMYGVKYKGRQLSIGEKVPAGAVLTLMVGDGGIAWDAGSIADFYMQTVLTRW